MFPSVRKDKLRGLALYWLGIFVFAHVINFIS